MMPATEAQTTSVEISTSLLDHLRARHPDKSDREMIEDIVQIDLGFKALRQSQKRNALSEAGATDLGVRAVHKTPR